jgi:hypothetical protein
MEGTKWCLSARWGVDGMKVYVEKRESNENKRRGKGLWLTGRYLPGLNSEFTADVHRMSLGSLWNP